MMSTLSFRSIAMVLSLALVLLAAASRYNPLAVHDIGTYNDESALSQLSP